MKKMTIDEMDSLGLRFKEEFPMTPQESQMVASGARKFGTEKKVSKGTCEIGSVPTPETLQPTEAKPFTHRGGVHQPHDHQPTLWGMRHCKGNTTPDTVAFSRTRMTGRANKTGWKANGTTKRGAKRIADKNARAAKWLAKHDI